jgi:hypothetical protein
MRELSEGLSPAIMTAAATYAADTTPVSVDCAGYDGATLLLTIGVGGITFTGVNKVDFLLEKSDDNSAWSNAVTADLIGVTVTSGVFRSLIAAKAAADVVAYRIVGSARYWRLTADFSGTHGTGTPIAATLIRGNPTVPVTA